ncbi:DNA/RNA non-specific endonuclease [Sphingobium sp. BYY-5]|uniref:DNA/RNA non-specific endonuclease n=1 Tax=Sphingobium sp. BYY-5 TaxID=2926400 RepID=UPI001FA819F9|nr:DNA/RNA non-specific endonuclease [Sphingobium sp. BYY-5]MCI4592634.1 DNA/RNA non-specific endonuclease [Sphingobium sp. BYY-5]
MGMEAADSIGQGSAGVGSTTSTSAAVASDMVNEHRTAGTLDTTALAADVQARTADDPQAQADLSAALETQMTPVEQGQFSAAMQAANDNSGYGVSIEGQEFAVGDFPDAPAAATWGSQPVGSGYKEAWDATAQRLGTTDPAAITAAIEAQLTPPSAVTTLDPIIVEGEAAPEQPASLPSEEGIGSFFEGLVKGDFSDNDSWSATAGQVIGGFIPVVGQIGDARDTVAAIGGVIEGKDGAWGNLGLAAIGWVPGLGDIAKGAIRGGEKALDAGGEIAQQAARHGDELADAVRPRIEMDGGRKGDWSPELNARTLKPDADYLVNGYTYRTDAQGRVSDVEGQLDLQTADRNSYQQGVSGREDRLADDQGGHLIASIFNGPGDRVNLVPMNGNFNMGAWRDLERSFQEALQDGKTVDVKIEVKYGTDSQRPDNFRVTYAIDGVPRTRMFDNVPGGQK